MNTTNLYQRLVRTLAGSAALLGGLAPAALAGELAPGSLLLFPEYDTHAGSQYLITVTNMHPTQSIRVLWVYVDGEFCNEFNRQENLTPNDTLTVLADFHNPQPGAGFLYVSAVAPGPPTSDPIAFNWLIGTATRIDGIEAFEYTVDPFTFEGLAPELMPTDFNGNGLQDFDGIEYSTVPDVLLVPRFLGQRPGRQSELVLLNLTGTVQFEALVDFLIYNDNEEVFSAQFSFQCWTKVSLSSISGVFEEKFLRNSTNHDPAEVVGASQVESGWFRIDGNEAHSPAQMITDPAILAFMSERTANIGHAAELPFGVGSQSNGELLNFSIIVAPEAKAGDPAFAPRR